MSNDPAKATTTDREFVHSRLIDAAREQVFAAIADPSRLARCWGPSGFTSTFEVFEFRPGGAWHQNLDRLAAEVLRSSSAA